MAACPAHRSARIKANLADAPSHCIMKTDKDNHRLQPAQPAQPDLAIFAPDLFLLSVPTTGVNILIRNEYLGLKIGVFSKNQYLEFVKFLIFHNNPHLANYSALTTIREEREG